ncbi:MAG: hypothetical protein J5798_05435 [Spirochaetaceae bacterium]|nr:hypothetical protein [Spirochaetaceae bacterium]
MKNKLLLIIYLFIIAIITSCGGGGGGGGAVAFQETAQLHNGGGNSGWGKGNQTGGGFNGGEIQSSTLLISQMAALNVTNVRIELTINDVAQTPINADASTTTDVLPKTKVGDKVSGRAYIYVAGESEPRVAELDETEIALSNTLKFKVPYKYRAYGLDSTTQVASGTYFARDGIDLSAHTTSTIAGWQCTEDGTTHFGSLVTGVRGDITLNAVLQAGATFIVTPSKTELVADGTCTDTATITITGGSGQFSVVSGNTSVINCTDSGSGIWTVNFVSSGASADEALFTDGTQVQVLVTDTVTNTNQPVIFTLKNKYTYYLKNHAGEGGSLARGPVDANSTLDFDGAKTIVSGYSTPVPTGRSIVAFKDTATGTVYKESQFPITFNSSNFSSRNITLQAVLDFTMTTKNAANTTWNTTETSTEGSNTYPLYTLEKYSTSTKELSVSISGCSANSNLSVSGSSGSEQYLEIAQTSLTSTGTFVIKLASNVTHDGIAPNGYTYKITVTDNGTGAKKIFFVKVAQPAEYKYSLVYQRGSGASLTNVAITGWQNKPFEPGTSLRFGVADGIGNLTMGDLDSSLTGLNASIRITGWKSTRASNPPIYNNQPFPTVGAADCESDHTITLIATTDYGLLVDAYRQDENAVQNGDIMLSSGLCVNKTFYTNHTSLLNSYVAGAVCKFDDGRKFVMAKNPGITSKKWSNTATNIGGLSVSLASGSMDDPSNATFSNNSTGKDSAAKLSGNISNYPAFAYCANYKPSGVTSGSYASNWYLPSIAEAVQIYKFRTNFASGFVRNDAWLMTSSQYSSSAYWFMNINENKLNTRSKTTEENRMDVYPCHEFIFVAP